MDGGCGETEAPPDDGAVALVADKSWVRTVSQHSQSRQAFVGAAIDFYRSEQAKTPTPSRKVRIDKRPPLKIVNKLASTGFMTDAGKPYAAAAVAKIIEA